MVNFETETLDMLQYACGKTVHDVLFVQTKKSQVSMQTFLRSIKGFEYDNGFGGHRINLDLKIVGKDWWLEREEYDGSEWWVFKTMPVRRAQTMSIDFQCDY